MTKALDGDVLLTSTFYSYFPS